MLVNGIVHIVDFVVVDESGQPSIMGLPSCQRPYLIKRVCSIKPEALSPVPEVFTEFLDVFMGLGKLPVGHTIKLSTGSNAVDPILCCRKANVTIAGACAPEAGTDCGRWHHSSCI